MEQGARGAAGDVGAAGALQKPLLLGTFPADWRPGARGGVTSRRPLYFLGVAGTLNQKRHSIQEHEAFHALAVGGVCAARGGSMRAKEPGLACRVRLLPLRA